MPGQIDQNLLYAVLSLMRQARNILNCAPPVQQNEDDARVTFQALDSLGGHDHSAGSVNRLPPWKRP